MRLSIRLHVKPSAGCSGTSRGMRRWLSLLVMLAVLATLAVVPAHGAQSAPDSLMTLARRISTRLTAREATITETYAGPIDALFDHLTDLMPAAVGMDDYLRFNLDSWRIAASGYPGDVTVTLDVRYLTTAQEEAELTERLAADMPAILAGATDDLVRVRLIDRVISKRIVYDEALREYSAVAGWLDGRTVCQGYALLTYRMCEMAGIPARILTGTLDGGTHAWNLVRVNGQWLHLDVTNNDASRSDRYFLVADDVLSEAGFLYDAALRERLIQQWERAERAPLAPGAGPFPARQAALEQFWGPVVILGMAERFQTEKDGRTAAARSAAGMSNAVPNREKPAIRDDGIVEKRRFPERPERVIQTR